ncbi:hypothetical protein KDL44_13570 [bacterium]|nr:hypothetical protein [bacterium]
MRMHRKRADLIHIVVEIHSNYWREAPPDGPGMSGVEQPLSAALLEDGIGEFLGSRWVDAEAGYEMDFVVLPQSVVAAVGILRAELKKLGAPTDTLVRVLGGQAAEYPVYGDTTMDTDDNADANDPA